MKTVDANIINTPDVNVVNTPDVTVINDEFNPVPVKVQESTTTMFLLHDRDNQIMSDSTGFTKIAFTGNTLRDGIVPTGYRAVLTHASVVVCGDKDYDYPAGTTWSLGVTIIMRAEEPEDSVVATLKLGSTPTKLADPTNASCVEVGVISQPLNLIVPSGLLRQYSIIRNYVGADEDYSVTVQGYLEQLSTP